MKVFFAVFKKEIKAYVDHPLAYILAIVFLAINHFLFFRAAAVEQVMSLRSMFGLMPWMLLFFVPALTMRSWAEERKEQTLSLLLSYPAQVWVIVAGKFAAAWAFVSAILLVSLTIPVSLGQAGDFDIGVVVAQYVGAILLAGAMVAVGQWASSLTKNQVVAFVVAIAVLVGFYLISLDAVLLSLPYPLNVIGQQLGLLSHFQSMTRGLIDLRDVLYFISLIVVFGALSVAWLYRQKTASHDPLWRRLQSTVAVIIAISVVVNLFGQSFTVRFDATAQNVYSLSGATKRILADLDDTVRFTFYRSKKLPAQMELVSRDIQDLLRDYQKFGGRHVEMSVKYPDQDEDVAQEAREAGIPAVRFNVLSQDEFTVQEGYAGISIEFLDDRETIPFVQVTDDLEYRLSRAIMTLRSSEKPKLGYVSDFGGKALEEIGAFSEELRQNYTVEQIRLSASEEGQSVDQIDETIDVLVVAGPTQTFSEPALAEIRAFIARGGKILWLLGGTTVDTSRLSAANVTTGLESILAGQGIEVQKDLVADIRSHETVNFSAGLFTYFYPYPYWIRANTTRHVLVGNVQQVMFPWPSSLKLAEGEQGPTPLVQTTAQGAHFTSNYQLSPDRLPDFTNVETGMFTLAAARENVPSDEGNPSGRWVVVANRDFLDDSMLGQYPQNAAFALNAIDWLSQNDALVAIRSKQSRPAAMIWPSKGAQSAAKWGNTVGAPVFVGLAGAYWLWRRRRYINSSN